MRTVTSHGPESSHGPILPLVILIVLMLFVPFALLTFVTFMASWPAR